MSYDCNYKTYICKIRFTCQNDTLNLKDLLAKIHLKEGAPGTAKAQLLDMIWDKSPKQTTNEQQNELLKATKCGIQLFHI